MHAMTRVTGNVEAATMEKKKKPERSFQSVNLKVRSGLRKASMNSAVNLWRLGTHNGARGHPVATRTQGSLESMDNCSRQAQGWRTICLRTTYKYSGLNSLDFLAGRLFRCPNRAGGVARMAFLEPLAAR
jgi:hypothetical protein